MSVTLNGLARPQADGSQATTQATSISTRSPAPQGGSGLAGISGGFSRVPVEDKPSPRNGQPEVPAVTVKASDLHARNEADSAAGMAPFPELAANRPRVDQLSGANQIGWRPGVHRDITVQAALKAGLSKPLAEKLAKLVVQVDDLPDSQQPENAHWHAMRSPGQSMQDYKSKVKAYIAECEKAKSLAGLARLIHRLQDIYSPAHTGEDGQPKEWHGLLGENIDLIKHVLEDWSPSSEASELMTLAVEKLIRSYAALCGGSLPN